MQKYENDGVLIKGNKIKGLNVKNHSYKYYQKELLIFTLKILRGFLLIGLTFVILLPLYKMFVDSINLRASYDYYFIPNGITFNNYIRVFEQFINEGVLLNSWTLSLGCALIQVMFSSIVGYGFMKLEKSNKFMGKVIFCAYLICLFIPHENMRVGYKYLLVEHPLFGIQMFGNKYAIFIMYLFGAGIKSPIFVYLFRAYYLNFNSEILEQARIDGCGPIKEYFKIILPLSLPVIIPTFFLAFAWIYNDGYFVDFFGLEYNKFNVIARNIYHGRARGGVTSTAFAMMLPVLLMYILVERNLIKPEVLDYS